MGNAYGLPRRSPPALYPCLGHAAHAAHAAQAAWPPSRRPKLSPALTPLTPPKFTLSVVEGLYAQEWGLPRPRTQRPLASFRWATTDKWGQSSPRKGNPRNGMRQPQA
jgi:hypothetical protein